MRAPLSTTFLVFGNSYLETTNRKYNHRMLLAVVAISSAVVNLCDELGSQQKQQYLLQSLPRSGSSLLATALTLSYPELLRPLGDKCAEYFNPHCHYALCTLHGRLSSCYSEGPALQQCFGSNGLGQRCDFSAESTESAKCTPAITGYMLAFPGSPQVNSVASMLRPCSSQDLERAYKSSWARANFTFTKEVFSPGRLPFFVQHFKTAVLLRAIRHTFPSGATGGMNAW